MSDDGRQTEVYTPTLVGQHVRSHATMDFFGARYRRGEVFTGRQRVRAPWWSVRVRGKRLPFTIDSQGYVLDEKRFERLLSG